MNYIFLLSCIICFKKKRNSVKNGIFLHVNMFKLIIFVRTYTRECSDSVNFFLKSVKNFECVIAIRKY